MRGVEAEETGVVWCHRWCAHLEYEREVARVSALQGHGDAHAVIVGVEVLDDARSRRSHRVHERPGVPSQRRHGSLEDTRHFKSEIDSSTSGALSGRGRLCSERDSTRAKRILACLESGLAFEPSLGCRGWHHRTTPARPK
jgi:hypothetical protein